MAVVWLQVLFLFSESLRLGKLEKKKKKELTVSGWLLLYFVFRCLKWYQQQQECYSDIMFLKVSLQGLICISSNENSTVHLKKSFLIYIEIPLDDEPLSQKTKKQKT